MPVQLLALTEGPNILLDKPILLLGRHPECDVQLNSRKVSRRHCCIARVKDFLVIRDLGSTNGLRINGKRVVEGRLLADDELTVGNFQFRVCFELPGQMPVLPRPVTESVLEEAEDPIPLDEDMAISRVLRSKPAL